MARYFLLLSALFLTIGCNQNADEKPETDRTEESAVTRLYSRNVADSFSIFLSLPNDYDQQKEKYPVVYLLDANLYFDIIATTLKKYSEVGLAPNVILVGIGYKDFPSMDSLRNRDYTYPVAIPEYEMTTSGDADKFLSFIELELMPHIGNNYRTDSSRSTLMGHSLGGYFTCYAALQNLSNKDRKLTNYIAASPSLHYNNYYLSRQLKEAVKNSDKKEALKMYVTYGGLEGVDNADDSNMVKQLGNILATRIDYKGDIFSNLDHMDTQIPSFVKGLQWALMQTK
jgi:predicted alpha/beta superfamily hydrolase